MNEPKTYIAINASAGSGKTYALVQRIIILCLIYPNRYDAIRHILALTFTNKAANEMKKRILDWLKAFTEVDYKDNADLKNIKQELEQKGILVTMEDLHWRSQKVLDYILHHYSVLNISTIDKFNSRLVRSFSYELGLAHQFNLEIQSEPYLIEAVDKMLDEIGKDDEISESFMDFVNYNLDNEERVSVNTTLYKKAKEFVKDIHYENLKNNENFDWEAYHDTKKKLRDEIAEHRKLGKELSVKGLQLIENAGLEIKDFSGGSVSGLGNYFHKYVAFWEHYSSKSQFPFPSDEEKALANYQKGTASKDIQIQNAVFSILDELLRLRSEIISQYISIEKKKIILKELLPLKFNKEIQEKLNEIEEENDLVLLSKFNILISENLKNEPSAFIYEKVGTRYQHFFLDEFQDTSKMQWENIIPLRDNAITSEHNTFTLVGDPKQSIYRFRGGDSDLMLDIINRKEVTPVPVSLENLENNWRSARHIVEFNNELYAFISRDLNVEHKELFAEKGMQIPRKKNTGRVKVCLTDYDRRTEYFWENVAEQMHRNIQECIDNGFRFSDITILCRGGREIQKFSQLLGNAKVRYNEEEVFIKTMSEKGLTLENSETIQAVIWFLKWQLHPENHQYMVKMMYALKQLGRVEMKDFSEEVLELLKLEHKAEIEDFIEEKYKVSLKQKDNLHLNLYNLVEYYIKEFSVPQKEVDFLLNFLELLYNFTQNAGLTLKDFVKFWDEEGYKTSIQVSENVDAIRMMTIHASKGLEFPVVFLPMPNSNKDTQFSDWLSVDKDALKSVNISGFKKELSVYDEEIEVFNTTNTYKNKIDRFCIQYVATTRPVEQLFLYLQKPSKSSNNLEIYEFIETKNLNNLDEFDLYPEVDGSFRKQTKDNTEKTNTLNIPFLSQKEANIGNITIATPSKQYQNTKESVREGIFAHEVLSKIVSAEDIDRVLSHYTLNGEITKEEAKEIKQRILSVIEDENYAKFFQKGLKIINEKDIMISENGKAKIYRPDRLVETEAGLYIIDFKTGKEKEKYKEQIERYQSALEKLGKKVLETHLIYL